MSTHSGRRWLRRSLTIPAALVVAGLALLVGPGLLVLALAFDLVTRRRSLSSLRVVAFALGLLVNEAVGLALLFGVFLATRARTPARERLTFRVQGLYTAAHLAAATRLFSLRFAIEGAEVVAPGPLLVLVRHASIIDTVIPGVFIANRHGLGLRYVLKRELLWGPCLDVAGHWVPNHFASRSGADTRAELEAVRALAAGLPDDGGVLIYPEGTRFSARRRDAALARLPPGSDRRERLAGLRHLLPPRPGGVLALLEAAPQCDLLVVGHHGFEGFAHLGDLWAGELVGKEVRVRFTRIGAARVPAAPEARLAFIDALWLELDDWLAAQARRDQGEEAPCPPER